VIVTSSQRTAAARTLTCRPPGPGDCWLRGRGRGRALPRRARPPVRSDCGGIDIHSGGFGGKPEACPGAALLCRNRSRGLADQGPQGPAGMAAPEELPSETHRRTAIGCDSVLRTGRPTPPGRPVSRFLAPAAVFSLARHRHPVTGSARAPETEHVGHDHFPSNSLIRHRPEVSAVV